MPRKSEPRKNMQFGLFEQEPPDIELPTARRQELTPLIEALLLEIAAALATQGGGDDQDHR